MSYATPDATIWDRLAAQQIANYESPWVKAQALEHQEKLRQNLLADQYAKLFQTQQFQRGLQEQQDRAAMERVTATQKAYFDRLAAEAKIKSESDAKEMGRRNESAKGNLQEMNRLQANLDALMNTDRKRQVTQIEKYAASQVAPLFASELAPLMKSGLSFEEAVRQVKDPVLRQEILAEYGNVIAASMTKNLFVDPAVQSRARATQNRIQQLNEALGKHMELGGELPAGDVGLLAPVQPEVQNALPRPPTASSEAGQEVPNIFPKPAQPSQDFRGVLPLAGDALSKIPESYGKFLNAVTLPVRTAVPNLGTIMTGGNFVAPSQLPTSDDLKRRAMEILGLNQPQQAGFDPGLAAITPYGFPLQQTLVGPPVAPRIAPSPLLPQPAPVQPMPRGLQNFYRPY